MIPAGDYGAVWAFGPRDVWLGNGAGQLLHYDGSRWQAYASGSRDPFGGIVQLWGEGGVLYFATRAEFGRWQGAGAEILLAPPADADYTKYPATLGRFWGRSASEVFIPLRDSRFESYACGGVFMVWFDGTLFHVF